MTLSYFAVMLMFDTFFGAMSRKETNSSKLTFQCVCYLHLNGRMDETLCFLLSESKGKFFNYVGCQVLRQTVHVNIFVRSQTAINLFENTCEDILNLSKVAGNYKKKLPAIQQHFCVAIPDIRHNTLLIFQSSFSQKLIKSLSSTLTWWLPI